MDIAELVGLFKKDSSCSVRQPNLKTGSLKQFPEDLKQFYELTDGISIFRNEPYSINIVSIIECIPINHVLFPQNDWEDIKGDISNNWYLIGDGGNGQYISIDISEERKGWCYDSFHETHGLVGDTPVIAKSFLELLKLLYQNKGKYWFWLEKDFERLGDAYDEN